MSSSLAIETHDLTRTFGSRVAVDRLELGVPRGAIYGFLGPNGAGKTTTIRMLLGLLRPSGGRILINGEPFTRDRRDLLRGVGAMVESPSLYPHLTGEENLDVTRRLLDAPTARVPEVLELFGLAKVARRPVRTYSTGMRQLLGLALAWIGRPSLLVLDEPTSSLDPAATRKLRAVVRRLAAEEGMTAFISSHVLGEVEQVADWVGIIHEGRLLFQGELASLKKSRARVVGRHLSSIRRLRGSSRMTEIVRAMAAERLKLKRTLAWRIAIGAPLTIVLLNFMVSERSNAGRPEDVLLGFAQLTLTTWTIIVLPLYTALAAALVAALEHQGNNWKHLFALPVERRSIFVAKWMAGAGLLLVSSIVLPIAVGVASEVLKGLKPALRGTSVPVALVEIRSFQVFCAAGLMLSIQLWVSLRWPSFIAGLAVGMGAVMILLGGVARVGFGTIVIYLYPWALPPTAMARMAEVHPDRLLVSVEGLVAGTLVAAVGCWRLSRLDMA